MSMANMNLIGVFVTKLWPVQALACGRGGDGGGGGGGDGDATKNIISPKYSNFGVYDYYQIWRSPYLCYTGTCHTYNRVAPL